MKSGEIMRNATDKFDSQNVLSDHAYQSTCFEDRDYNNPERTSIFQVGSYNTQDKCVSIKTNQKKDPSRSFANSPFINYDEKKQDYIARKKAQIDFIIEMIKAGEDIIFLQEIDFLTRNESYFQDLRNTLMTKLAAQGYNIAISNPTNPDGTRNQPMATIYKNTRFDFCSSQGVFSTEFAFAGQNPYNVNRGFEVVLYDKTAKKEIVATNLHLKYGHDYGDAIYQYQLQQVRNGRFCVLGGDTNNIQNENLKTALGDWNLPTNFTLDKSNGELTTLHSTGERTTQKAYDRFFASSSSPSHYVLSTPTARSQKVSVENGVVKFSYLTPAERNTSRSMPGEPWRRGRDVLKDLVSEYDQSHETNKTICFNKIVHCIEWKSLNILNLRANGLISEELFTNLNSLFSQETDYSLLNPAPSIITPKASFNKPSQFIPFEVCFKGVSANNQARVILAKVNKISNSGKRKVGITYSANQEQTNNIIDKYKKNEWRTGTNGANQAEVIAQIEILLTTPEYEHLQKVFRIIPITTMQYKPPSYGIAAADDDSVKMSLQNADEFIARGGVLLGWRNELTPENKLAIGGGISKGVMTQNQKQLINAWTEKMYSTIHVHARGITSTHLPSRVDDAVPIVDNRKDAPDANVVLYKSFFKNFIYNVLPSIFSWNDSAFTKARKDGKISWSQFFLGGALGTLPIDRKHSEPAEDNLNGGSHIVMRSLLNHNGRHKTSARESSYLNDTKCNNPVSHSISSTPNSSKPDSHEEELPPDTSYNP